MTISNIGTNQGKQQRGVTLVEYAIAVAILLVVFISAMGTLKQSSKDGSDRSISSAQSVVPCGNGTRPSLLAADECL